MNWCELIGHDDRPTVFFEWEADGYNFECYRCGKKFKTFEETKTNALKYILEVIKRY